MEQLRHMAEAWGAGIGKRGHIQELRELALRLHDPKSYHTDHGVLALSSFTIRAEILTVRVLFQSINLSISQSQPPAVTFQACRMSLKRSRETLHEYDANNRQDGNDIFESLPIEDRASKFIGLFSSVVSAKDLQAHEPYKKASHRILAWRKPSNQQSLMKFKTATDRAPQAIYTTGYDDDGEKYAGKRLEKLLIDLDVVGAIVVARWYGGNLLGPVRFTHIDQVARDAIAKWRASQGVAVSSKKQKVESTTELTPEQESEQKSKLAKLLVNRDNSIKVLRELLTEKKATSAGNVTNTDTQPNTPPVSTPSSTIDYGSMPLNKLKQLEKAKDTTISWILKQIDEVEAKSIAESGSAKAEEG